MVVIPGNAPAMHQGFLESKTFIQARFLVWVGVFLLLHQ